MPQPKLHPKAQAIFRFILDYKKEHDGLFPSLREIQAACNISSTSIVAWHLTSLERFGKLEKVHGPDQKRREARYRVVGGRWSYSGSFRTFSAKETDLVSKKTGRIHEITRKTLASWYFDDLGRAMPAGLRYLEVSVKFYNVVIPPLTNYSGNQRPASITMKAYMTPIGVYRLGFSEDTNTFAISGPILD